MKQKLFMVLAAMMLLVSTSASAQNVQQNEVNDTAALAAKAKAENQAAPKKTESQTPLKGDVNEDGVVDVADIAAVIAIMKNGGGTGEETKYYWYIGTTKPTSLDYEGVTTVDEYPAEQLYTNETGSYSKIYILTKNDKTVTLYDANLGGMGEFDDPDTITIPGYIIWTTYDEIPNTGKIRIVISSTNYWYVGTVNPMNVNTINPKDIVSDASSMGWRYIGATVPTYTMQNPLWNGQVNEIVFDNYKDITAYIALPNSVIKVRDGLGNDVTGQMKYLGEKEINGVTYTVYQNGNVVMAYSLDCLVY